MKSMLVCLVAMLITPLALLNAADLKLAAVFSDHMVLQRDKSVPVWGWGDPGEQLTVEIFGQKRTVIADAAGKWMVTLDPLKASAEPLTLVVQSDKPERKVQAVDVLVGEVWLGSGQSNMAMPVGGSRDADKEKADSDLPMIRMFKESSGASKTNVLDAKGTWLVCSSNSVGGFSGTLFFFGRELHRELKVPVGLINSSVGGTPIESWIAEEAQKASPELKAALEEAAKAEEKKDRSKELANYEKALAKWDEQVSKAKAEGKPIPNKPVDPAVRREQKGGAGGLFNGKIAPLIPYAIRGAVWYQGESNALRGNGALYQYQLPLLVSDWRKRWGDEFPFAWVQLPNFKCQGEGWMLVREAMLKSLKLPDTGMAITVDIGESGNIHPRDKQEVGRRLSLWALGKVYGRKTATSGPLPSAHEVKGGEFVVSFSHCDGGLQAKGGDLKGFVIAGDDRQWKPAAARIDGETVIVTSPDAAAPVAVRYAWEPDPVCNLYNGEGLPASPFRTDDWAVPAPVNSKEP